MNYLEKGFSNVLDILKFSDERISKNAVIRLHEVFKIGKGKFYLKKYFDNKSLNIDFGAEPFYKARQNSRLTFFNYDSTGILENLLLNYPTICMWDDFDECISDDFMAPICTQNKRCHCSQNILFQWKFILASRSLTLITQFSYLIYLQKG